MKNAVKEKILMGQKVLGTFHELGSATAIEMLGYGGLDFVIIDTEHGPFEVERVQEFIRAAHGTNAVPMVRTKDSERNSILKMLDVGAMGLIIPNVNSLEEIKRIVEYGKYFPIGNRGVAPTSGSKFWTDDYASQGLNHYFSVSNRESLLLPQCETRECLESIEQIVAIDGVDGIFVGPYDLSTSLGKPGQFSDPEVSGAIERVLKACQAANKLSFIYAGSLDDVAKKYVQGFNAVCYGMDALILKEAIDNIVSSVKGK
ncbi:MAG TPA: aldolase/citrate lyase family protein [Clostridia bacterium]|nr:aldolase/citrate lyase family protein [Clostridia bacterium]